MTIALIAIAVALAVWPVPGPALTRVTSRDRPGRLDMLFHGEPRWIGRTAREPDPFAIAAAYDLLAVCLRAGLPVGVAASVAADRAPEPLAGALMRAAELLALGADPAQAWSSGGKPDESFGELSMLARRAARAGSSLAEAIAGLAEATRVAAQTQALARAERAGVTISGPLGLCFLPAFVCLGIVPVVVGLADGMLSQW
ncbi:MAG: type II secretion system F family protein [Gordonia sp. (in: high G+C Gram-positive bacteria)]|uniref:type II secretion system F family protein n=1 Tax=Gordonia sp. (in: high G+C Gram-positive bacteria) TaxID=84139 RepID=UPI003BB80C19